MIGYTDKITAIVSLVPGAEVSVIDDKVTWHKPSIAPVTDAQIDAEMVRLQTEYDAQEYARKRAAEYPSIAELTVALYDEDDKAALETKRAAVKKKWPKDNSGPVE